MTHTTQEEVSAASQSATLKNFRRWRVLLGSLGLGIAIYVAILAANWPFTKADLVHMLEARSLRTVTIEHFHRTYFPPGCVAEGIGFLRIKHPDKPAVLTIRQLVVEDNYPAVLLCQRRLSNVKLIGLHLVVPAKEPPGEPSPVMPLTYSDSGNPIRIGTISADGAILEFLSEQPGVQPFRLIVRKLSLYNVGGETPISYQTEIYNPKPSGEISSSGTWGPWDPHHPDTTTVKGEYEYRNVRLSSLPDLNGTLDSRGNFNGTLAQINVGGDASVSDFRIGNARHSSQLKAKFQAVVDATKGDVRLSQVLARLNRTVLALSGSVAGAKQQPGKTVTLTVHSSKARVEDLFGLFASENQPPMSGNIAFRSNISVPPGEATVLQRMSLKGVFGIDAGLFSDKSTEREMAKLSVSAVRGDKEEDRENPQTVLLNVKGRVEASRGTARVDRLSFDVPGAQATLTGTFSLSGYQSNMHGVLTTTGDVADATTGIKSVFLKALTPLFEHRHRTKVVPFKVTGPLGKTTVSLDLGSKK
jgi:hypothetical protein